MEWIEIMSAGYTLLVLLVSTLAVEWIEIIFGFIYRLESRVSTLAVEWIEIYGCRRTTPVKKSPPSRWSGLKSLAVRYSRNGRMVSTLAVEWIEIFPLPMSVGAVLSLHPRGGVD